MSVDEHPASRTHDDHEAELPKSVWDVRLQRNHSSSRDYRWDDEPGNWSRGGGRTGWLWRSLLRDRSIDTEDFETLAFMGFGYALFVLLMAATMRQAYRKTLAEFQNLKSRATVGTHPPTKPIVQ